MDRQSNWEFSILILNWKKSSLSINPSQFIDMEVISPPSPEAFTCPYISTTHRTLRKSCNFQDYNGNSHILRVWITSRLTPLYPTNGLSYAPGSRYIVVGGKAVRNAWHGCHGRHLEGRHLEGRHLGSNFGILNGKGACDMSFNTSLISDEQGWSPFPPTLSCW
jgi:hypothetical protein